LKVFYLNKEIEEEILFKKIIKNTVSLRPTNPNPVSAPAALHLVAAVGLRLDGP